MNKLNRAITVEVGIESKLIETFGDYFPLYLHYVNERMAVNADEETFGSTYTFFLTFINRAWKEGNGVVPSPEELFSLFTDSGVRDYGSNCRLIFLTAQYEGRRHGEKNFRLPLNRYDLGLFMGLLKRLTSKKGGTIRARWAEDLIRNYRRGDIPAPNLLRSIIKGASRTGVSSLSDKDKRGLSSKNYEISSGTEARVLLRGMLQMTREDMERELPENDGAHNSQPLEWWLSFNGSTVLKVNSQIANEILR